MKSYKRHDEGRRKNSRHRHKPNTEGCSRDEYLKIRAEYTNLSTNQSNLLDKSLLTVSGIVLAFSLTYIDKLAPLKGAKFSWLIISSWVFLSISCAFTIISLYAAHKCTCSYIKQFDDHYTHNNIGMPLKSAWEKTTEWSNILSFFLFLVGITTLIAFSAINFDISHGTDRKMSNHQIKEDDMTSTKPQILTEGSKPHQPPSPVNTTRGATPQQPPVQSPASQSPGTNKNTK